MSCCSPAGSGRQPALPLSPPTPAAPPQPAGVVWFKGGRSHVGTARPMLAEDGEGPVRKVTVAPFGLEPMAVSHADFARFVAATGYVTEAEHYGWSFVFVDFLPPGLDVPVAAEAPWWTRCEGADWRNPAGPAGAPVDQPDHPAVHISWRDASAYATWRGGRLPTEAEWEFAARPSPDAEFPWGNEEPSDTTVFCNIWQGDFPRHNTLADGYAGTAPVRSFAPNAFGMYNMAGNVWEWCADPFRVRSLAKVARHRDRAAVAAGERLLKGGSHLCHRSYCYRYRIAARMGRPADTTTGHIGFRVAYDP